MRTLTLILCLLTSPMSWSNIYVVVSPNSQIETITKKELAALYLGRKRAVESGVSLYAIDRDGELRSEFFQHISNMSINQIDAYWARLRFSGRVAPLKSLDEAGELKQYLIENPKFIGYLSEKPQQDELKVVMVIYD